MSDNQRKRYTIICHVCGKEGHCDKETFISAWTGGLAKHSNPRICEENLKKEAVKKENNND